MSTGTGILGRVVANRSSSQLVRIASRHPAEASALSAPPASSNTVMRGHASTKTPARAGPSGTCILRAAQLSPELRISRYDRHDGPGNPQLRAELGGTEDTGPA